MKSKGSTNGDRVTTSESAAIVGSIRIDLGDGPNAAALLGTFEGDTVSYRGGDGVDHLTYGMTESPARLRAALGAGDDILTLNAGAALGRLSVDFGAGTDTFENLLGSLPSGTKLVHLP